MKLFTILLASLAVALVGCTDAAGQSGKSKAYYGK